MGLFGFLRGKDERAIPEPGTPEFDAAVRASALPDGGSVEMGQSGWTSAAAAAEDALRRLGIDPSQAQVEHEGTHTIDLRGTDAREKLLDALRSHGIDPDEPGQRIDASSVSGLQEAIFGALGEAGVSIPGAGGFGGGVGAPQQDPIAQVEHLARKRDTGEITDAEFEAQKRRLLG